MINMFCCGESGGIEVVVVVGDYAYIAVAR